MLANLGGFFCILTFLINWIINFAASPIHVAKLVEKLYKRTSPHLKSTIPKEYIIEDEIKDLKPKNESFD